MTEEPTFSRGVSAAQAQALAEFPQVLQNLVQKELAAGNRIVEIASGFPAPPVGACLKLARLVSTRPRDSDDELQFYARNNSSYSGEFTDSKRFFFVLEPPLPPEPEPDMEAIRAEQEARQRAADAALRATADQQSRELQTQAGRSRSSSAARSVPPPPSMASSLVDRFLQSMEMNHERWHDGVGYDLKLLKSASPAEREQLEHLLISGGVRDWRDVEALAALDSPAARAALRRAFESGDDPLRIALLSHAPDLFVDAEHTATLVSALESTRIHGELTQTLLLVESHHPPPVVEALLRGVLARDGATAGHFAAMLLFLHGKAAEPYDMDHRPFFLEFQNGDREQLFRQLCERIGLGPEDQRRLMA